MKLTRRKFIAGTLVIFASPIIYKTANLSFNSKDPIKGFLSNYDGIVSLENYSELSCPFDIKSFEKKLRLLLDNNPQQFKLNDELNTLIIQDYKDSRVDIADGWILSETELCIELLRKKHV